MRSLIPLVLPLVASLALAGCGNDRVVLISATFAGGAGATNVHWNGITEAEGMLLDYPDDSTLRGEGLEFYAGTTRVPLTSTTIHVMGEGGPFKRTIYDATALPPRADYTVVHRRASGTGDPYTAEEEAAFTTFEGDPALVTTLQVYSTTPDAGPD